jgi:hypothetical protein
MPAAQDARKTAFSRFVRRALDQAKVGRGWGVDRVVEEAAKAGRPVGRATIYRWLNSEWTEAPSPDLIEAFCDVLDIPPAAAFAVLWPGKTGRAQVTPPPELDPDVETLLRRLQDPNVADAEKYHIRETLKTLAARSAPPKRATGR